MSGAHLIAVVYHLTRHCPQNQVIEGLACFSYPVAATSSRMMAKRYSSGMSLWDPICRLNLDAVTFMNIPPELVLPNPRLKPIKAPEAISGSLPSLNALSESSSTSFRISTHYLLRDKIGRYIIYDVHPRDYLSPSTIMPVYRGSEHEKGGLYACKGDLFATLVGKVLSVRNIVSQSVERLTIYNDPPAKLVSISQILTIIYWDSDRYFSGR